MSDDVVCVTVKHSALAKLPPDKRADHVRTIMVRAGIPVMANAYLCADTGVVVVHCLSDCTVVRWHPNGIRAEPNPSLF